MDSFLTGEILFFVVSQAFLQIFAPGEMVKGQPTIKGNQLDYCMNGWFSLMVTLLTVIVSVQLGHLKPTILADMCPQLMTTSLLFSFIIATFLYFAAELKILNEPLKEKTTGVFIYDYFMGASINPRLGSFDFKLFCESRPVIIVLEFVKRHHISFYVAH
jgi:hypothetical protein